MDEQPMGQGSVPPQKGGNKKVLWIVLAILIIGGLIWYFMPRKSVTNEYQTKSANDNAPAQNQVMSKNQSLKQLMASGVSQQCNFTYTGKDNTQSQGQVSISSGKVRAMFDSTVNGKEIKSNMINDGQNVYVWMDGQTTGMKMSSIINATTTPPTPPQGAQSIDPNSNYDYSCTPGSVAADAFQLPAGVTFNDINQIMTPPPVMMKGGSPTGQYSTGDGSVPNKAQMCAACDNAGSGKAQCLAALGCK